MNSRKSLVGKDNNYPAGEPRSNQYSGLKVYPDSCNREHTEEQQTRMIVPAAFHAKSSSGRERWEKGQAVFAQDHLQTFRSAGEDR